MFHKYLKPASWNNIPHPPIAGLKPYQVIAQDGSDTGLFTGYFEPTLRGSFTKKPPYLHPVYAAPTDMPIMPDRAEIAAGALANKNLELLYVDDAVDLFFAHVQGSAAVQMDDGKIQRISFAAKSGHPYTAIGKTLKDRGALHLPITMDSIKAWLREHPDQQQEIFNTNASHIFFKRNDANGPVGASGEALIAEQSLAIDDSIWPYGLTVIVRTTDPREAGKPFIRVMRTQDKGSAIRGVIRGDIYFGSGDEAAQKAGPMNAQGQMWVCLPE